jgi:hypothetical protein
MVWCQLTEIIHHFAGYMRLFEDGARIHGHVEGAPIFFPQDDIISLSFEPADYSLSGLETIKNQGLNIRLSASEEIILPPDLLPRSPFEQWHISMPALTDWVPERVIQAASPGISFERGLIIPQVHVSYGKGGEQLSVSLHQSNVITDHDVVHLKPDWNEALVQRAEEYIALSMDDMQAMAQMLRAELAPMTVLPDTLTAESLKEWWDRHEWPDHEAGTEDLDGHQETATPQETESTSEGYSIKLMPDRGEVYVNGQIDGTPVLSDEMYTASLTVRLERSQEDSITSDPFVAGVQTGANTAYNAAQIIDFHNTVLSVLIKGNSYSFDAIIQCQVAWGSEAMPGQGASWSGWLQWHDKAYTPGQVLADNIASFTQSGEVMTVEGGYGPQALLNWSVDIFEGDFLDICLLRQLNIIGDNDLITGLSSDELLALSTGGNMALSLSQFLSLDLSYDFIILEGSYYEANLIFQQNILMDTDWLEGVNNGFNPNLMRNQAEIMHYGNTSYQDVPDSLDALYQRILAGETGFTLDEELTEWLAHASTDLSILYIKGDYYNINIIEQTNLVADADRLSGQDGWAQTGDNLLANEAMIISSGALAESQYLEGDVYEDSLLIQASYVETGDLSAVQEHEALMPEVIAFLGQDTGWQRDDSTDETATTVTLHDDPMAGILT